MYSTDREDKIEGRGNAIPLLTVKAKKRPGEVLWHVCYAKSWFTIPWEKQSITKYTSRYGAWQVGLQPCVPVGLHACIAGSTCGVCISTTGKCHPFFSQLLCRLISKKAIWAGFAMFFSKYIKEVKYTFRTLSLSAGVEITGIIDRQQKRNLTLVRLSESILSPETYPRGRWTIILLFNSPKLPCINNPY